MENFKICSCCVMDTKSDPSMVIEANGKSTKIYVEALYHSGTQRPYLKIASGVDATPSKSYVKV